MTPSADEIRDIERRRLAAIVGKDMATAEQLHSEDYELITPLGVALSKQQYLGAIGSGQLNYVRFEPVSEITVRVTSDSAVVRYQAAIAFPAEGPAGPGTYWHTDVYQLSPAGWRAVCSQATLIRPGD